MLNLSSSRLLSLSEGDIVLVNVTNSLMFETTGIGG